MPLRFVFVLALGCSSQTVTGAKGTNGAAGLGGNPGSGGAAGVLDPTPPSAPTGLRVSASADGPPSYVLHWVLPSGALARVNVYNATANIDDSNPPAPEAVAAAASSTTVQIPPNSGVQRFRVSAVSDSGVEGAFSKELVIDTTLALYFGNTTTFVDRARLDVGGETLLASALNTGTVTPGNFALSPDGNFLAFSAPDAADLSELYIVNAAGGAPVQVSTSSEGVLAGGVQWSPDSQSIIYAGGITNSHFYAARIDGSSKVIFTPPDTAFISEAAWSPDGNWLAYRLVVGSQSQLFITSSSSDSGARVDAPPSGVADTASLVAFEWLPNSSAVIFSEDSGLVFRADATAPSGAQVLNDASTLVSGTSHAPFASSPDGQRLALSVAAATSNELWIGAATGGNFVQASTKLVKNTALVWSDDGNELAYVYFDSGTTKKSVALANTGGFNQHYSTAACDVTSVSFSPDSQHFISQCGASLYLFELGSPSPLTSVTADAFSWSPDGGLLAWFGPSTYGYVIWSDASPLNVSLTGLTLGQINFPTFGVPSLVHAYKGG